MIRCLRRYLRSAVVGIGLFLTCAFPLRAEVPMPGEIGPVYPDTVSILEEDQGPPSGLIRLYDRLSSRTIHRCPYRTSCSRYAARAFSEHGTFFGLLLTIDRYYFRENHAAQKRYPHIYREGRVLLDDELYYYSDLNFSLQSEEP